MSSNNSIPKNMQSIFGYTFKSMFLIILFNFFIIMSTSKLIFNQFYFASQDKIFANIYNKIEDMEELDVSSDEFREIVNACQYSNCSIEVYDTDSNKRIYSSYLYKTEVFANVESKPIFDGIIGEDHAKIINGVNENFEAQQAVNSLNGRDNVYSLLIRYSDTIYILVQTPMDMRSIYQEMLLKMILLCLVVSFVLGIFLAYFLARDTVKNIVAIKNTAKKIAENDFSERCRTNKFSEFFELSCYINQMADSLKNQMGKIEKQNSLLEEDIERRKKVEVSQKEFISNVSHELKTPISIISGYVEGLKYGVVQDEDKEKYYDTVISECQRMGNIIKQLLKLSSLENVALDIEKNDVSQMVNDIYNRFSFKVPERKFVLKAKEGLFARYDYDEIDRVITNYLENAVKYSYGDIFIKAYDSGRYVHIGIISMGTIGDADIDRIWERFYRADKSHKRSENSTGLGLSIVKAAMERHGMPYGVLVKNGTVEFYIELEK